MTSQAFLALEDGQIFRGEAHGASGECSGEVVFNTAITGYQEIFTDPSYAGQIVILTNPEIGNYGTNPDDSEAGHPYIEGLVVREFSAVASNWRSRDRAEEFLARQHIPVISGLDTRALVRHLRNQGVMRGVISNREGDPRDLVARARSIPAMTGQDLATRVSTPQRYEWDEPPDPAFMELHARAAPREARYRVVAYDFGIKRNILRRLAACGCHVTVVPASTTAEDVLTLDPDGIFLSNGPGDPEPLQYQARQVRALIGKKPIFGICLGHQILGLAVGGRTYKLKFGHRGANHPVKNLVTGKVEITSHNHGFAVDPDSLDPGQIELTHMNLNDQALEGFRHRWEPVFCVQYHPEAAPGPHDSLYLFDDFVRLMEEFKARP
jgi:carbamoyl-phosphate synthase small subunit